MIISSQVLDATQSLAERRGDGFAASWENEPPPTPEVTAKRTVGVLTRSALGIGHGVPSKPHVSTFVGDASVSGGRQRKHSYAFDPKQRAKTMGTAKERGRKIVKQSGLSIERGSAAEGCTDAARTSISATQAASPAGAAPSLLQHL